MSLPIAALIFDFDGLIVDTETAVYQSWREIYQRHGHDLPLATYVQCVGSTIRQFNPSTHLNELSGQGLNLPELQQEHRARVHRALVGADTLPGVRERLAEAHAAGFKLAVASSSPSEWIHPWLARLDLAEYFTVVRTRDMVKNAKPDPELFLAAAHGLGVAVEQALVFEDSHNGLRAARAANMPCVIVPNAITCESDFSAASLVLQSLAEIDLPAICRRVRG